MTPPERDIIKLTDNLTKQEMALAMLLECERLGTLEDTRRDSVD